METIIENITGPVVPRERWLAQKKRYELLEQEFEAYKKGADAYRKEVNAYRKEVDAYRKEADAYRKEADAYKKRADAYKKEVDAYKKGADAYKKGADAYKKEADAYRKKTTVLIKGLKAQLKPLLRKVYGKSSEKLDRPQSDKSNRHPPKDPAETKAKRKKNKEAKKELESEIKDWKPSTEELHCPHCGDTEFKEIGRKVSGQIEYVPARFKRIRHHRHTMQCKCKQTIVTAKAPPNVREGVQYGPGFHAHVAVSKVLDALPLERQSKMFARQGCAVAPSTLCNIFHRTGEEQDVIAKECKRKVQESKHVFADETTISVQPQGVPASNKRSKKKKMSRKYRGRSSCHRAYFWVFLSKSAVYYTFSSGRGQATVKEVLKNTKGTLMADGYSGYNCVCSDGKDIETDTQTRKRAGCNGHARRKFFDTPIEEKAADWFLKQYQNLYAIESEAVLSGIFSTEAHLALRTKKSTSLMKAMKKRAESLLGQFEPVSLMGKALRFFLNQWSRLTLFLRDSTVALDNNISERMLRLLALARKNFLFVGNLVAGKNLANILSVVQTCQL